VIISFCAWWFPRHSRGKRKLAGNGSPASESGSRGTRDAVSNTTTIATEQIGSNPRESGSLSHASPFAEDRLEPRMMH
jgi:hypothetical protein